AAELDVAGVQGVYFLPNPVRPDLAGTRTFPTDPDVDRRTWLLIDCDPDRPAGVSASAAERAAAWAVLDRCRGTLEVAGFRGAVVGDSGNGWHLCYPIDLPNDDGAKQLVKKLLAGLQGRCGDRVSGDDKAAVKARQFLSAAKAHVGAECHDVRRIWAGYGRWKRKGTATPERPHRLTRLIEGTPWSEDVAAGNNAALARMLQLWAYIDKVRKGRLETTARSYGLAALRQECAAVAETAPGDRNNQLFRSAAKLAQPVPRPR